jgi:hypothetical protein
MNKQNITLDQIAELKFTLLFFYLSKMSSNDPSSLYKTLIMTCLLHQYTEEFDILKSIDILNLINAKQPQITESSYDETRDIIKITI